MQPVLNIGPLAIQTPGLILLTGVWLGWWLSEKKYTRFAVQPAIVNHLVIAGLVTIVIGGRIAYIAEHLSAFIKSPSSLVSLNPSLWDLPAGIVIGLAVSGWYGARHKIRIWSLLDALTPGFAVMMVAVSLANLASGNAYGEPTRLPWSIFLWGEWRHPTQIYALLGSLFILFFKVLLPLSKNPQNDKSKSAGLFFLEFIAWSATVQLFLGSFRGDAPLIASQVRSIQVEAWLVLATCLIILGGRRKQAEKSPGETIKPVTCVLIPSRGSIPRFNLQLL